MRNRAKCKKCLSIIESYHRSDRATCLCGEISIDGGLDRMLAQAIDWANFLRVDDEGNEIIVTVRDAQTDTDISPLQPDPEGISEQQKRPSREDLLGMMDRMIDTIEGLPPVAMALPVTHYDLLSALLLLRALAIS